MERSRSFEFWKGVLVGWVMVLGLALVDLAVRGGGACG